MANPENKQLPYESTQKDIRDGIDGASAKLTTTELTPRNLADVLAEEIKALTTVVGGLNFINCVVVAQLPTTGISTTTIYLVPKSPAQQDNVYDEYINLDGTVNGWEKIGDTEIDLSNYYTKTETDTLLSAKANTSDIPTVNDGTLTIQQNRVTKASFSANTASNVTADIEVPTADKKTATDEFTTADGGLLSKCQINLVPVQSGSGDPSPDNVRPISGHTEVDLYNVGKNWLDNSSDKWTQSTIGGTGYASNNTRFAPSNFELYLEEQKTYVFSLTNNTGLSRTFQLTYYIYDENDNVLDYVGWQNFPYSFTTPEKTSKMIVAFRDTDNNNTAQYVSAMGSTLFIQLELGDQATAYEPYNPSSHLYQVQIGSTVYGGSLDIVSGSGEDAYTNIASYNGETINEPWISSMDVYTEGGTPTTGAQVVYPKTTATAISTTPQQIEALPEQNNLSCPLSGQSIETNGVEYKELFTFADVKEIVNLRVPISTLGTDENGRTTASRVYTKGEHFYKDGKFCTALVNIASGATFTLGTNYAEGDVASSLVYKSGDTFTIADTASYICICGSSGTVLRFLIPLSKPVVATSAGSWVGIKFKIRSLRDAQTDIEFTATASNCTVQIVENGLLVILSGLSLTNQYPYMVTKVSNSTITFS